MSTNTPSTGPRPAPSPARPTALSTSPGALSPAALELRRAVHKTVAVCSDDLEQFRFNRAVARIYELANSLGAFKAAEGGDFWALREGLELLVRLVAPMMPHLGEELWQLLGHDGFLVDQPWPVAETALLSDEMATLAVQVNGKKRATITLPVDTAEGDAEAAALADPSVQRAMDGKSARKVIVVRNRIVNVVV